MLLGLSGATEVAEERDAHRPGPALCLLARALQLSVPPGALLRTRPRNLGLALLLRALRRVACHQQRRSILGRILCCFPGRVRHRPAPHVILRLAAAQVPVLCYCVRYPSENRIMGCLLYRCRHMHTQLAPAAILPAIATAKQHLAGLGAVRQA